MVAKVRRDVGVPLLDGGHGGRRDALGNVGRSAGLESGKFLGQFTCRVLKIKDETYYSDHPRSKRPF